MNLTWETTDTESKPPFSSSACAAFCRCALALNPSLDVNQYAHTAWTIRDGFFRSAIFSIAQTADGYLWLGTESGLLRFDGVRAVPWTPPGSEDLSGATIRRLLGTRDGALWIGTDKGLVSWKGARLTRYPELDGHNVSAIAEDHEGTVWVGSAVGPSGVLCEVQSRRTRCFGQDSSLGKAVFSIHEDAGVPSG